MRKNVSEKWLLKKMDIPDWRHMSKDKITTFVSSLPYLDPEVAKAAIDQFPNFASLAKELVGTIQTNFNTVVSSNETITKESVSCIQQSLECLFKQLDRDDLSDNERLSIRTDILELNKMVVDLSKEYQKTQFKNMAMVAMGIAGVIGCAASILGSNSKQEYLDADDTDNELL